MSAPEVPFPLHNIYFTMPDGVGTVSAEMSSTDSITSPFAFLVTIDHTFAS